MTEGPAIEKGPEKSFAQLVRFVGLSQGVQPVVTIGISILIARSLGPEGRGAYGLMVTSVAMLPLVFGVGLENAIRYWSARGQVDSAALLGTSTLLAALLGALCGAIAFASWALAWPAWLVPADLGALGAAALVAALFLASLRSFWSNYLSGLEEYGFAAWGTNAATAVQLGALAWFWLRDAVSLNTVIVAFLLQFAFSFGLFLVMAGRKLRAALRARPLPFAEVVEMCRYGRWQYLAAVLNQTNLRLNIFLLAALGGLYETGLYTAVAGPAAFLGLVASPFTIVLTARTARRSDDPEFPRRVASAIRLIGLLMGVAAVAAALVAPVVLPFIFGEQFREGVTAFWILLPGVISFSLMIAMAQFMAGSGRPEWNTRVSGVAAVLTIGLNVLLIPRMGANGAALAYSVAFTMSLGMASFAFLAVSGLRLHDLLVPRATDWQPLLRVIAVGPLRRLAP